MTSLGFRLPAVYADRKPDTDKSCGIAGDFLWTKNSTSEFYETRRFRGSVGFSGVRSGRWMVWGHAVKEQTEGLYPGTDKRRDTLQAGILAHKQKCSCMLQASEVSWPVSTTIKIAFQRKCTGFWKRNPTEVLKYDSECNYMRTTILLARLAQHVVARGAKSLNGIWISLQPS